MSTSNASQLSGFLRRLVGQPGAVGSDSEVLARFAQHGDQDAFAILVGRHGPLVRRVCQSVLGGSADVDDAFQATFVVLARKAGSLPWQSSIASWLHAVAHRVSKKLYSRTRRAAALDQIDEPECAADPDGPLTVAEAEIALHEVLAALPEKYRAPVVLCYLQEKTQDEAAKILGWSVRTLQRRLRQGRDVLKLRLQKRGIALSAALSASLFTAAASQAVPAPLLHATVQAAIGRAPSSTSVLSLAEGTIQAMQQGRLKLVLLAGLLAVTLIAAIAILFVVSRPNPTETKRQPDSPANEQRPAAPAMDPFPLPAKAVRRFGDLLFRTRSTNEYGILQDAKVVFASGEYRDITTGKLVRRWYLKPVLGVIAFSHDGKLVACSKAKGTLDIWNFKSQKRIHSLRTHRKTDYDRVEEIRFSRDNTTVAAEVTRQSVQVWNVATGVLQATLRTEPGGVNIALSPDGGKLATWRRHETFGSESVQVWNVRKQRRIATVHIPGGNIRDADFSKDGNTIAIVEQNGAVHMANANNGKILRKFDGPKEGAKIAFDPRGGFLVIAARTGRVQRRRLGNYTLADACQGPPCKVRDFIFTKDGRTLIYGRDGLAICLWEAPSGKVFSPRPGHHGLLIGLAFSRDGKNLISLGGRRSAFGSSIRQHGHAIRIWNVATGKQLRTLQTLVDFPTAELSPRGRYVAAGKSLGEIIDVVKENSSLELLDITTGKKVGTLARQYRTLAFSADEKIMATAATDRKLCLWETATLRQIEAIPLQDNVADAAAFSEDKRLLVYREARALRTGSEVIKIWDRKLQKVIAECRAPGFSRVENVALSPDGKILAAVCHARGIGLWQARESKFLGFLPDSAKYTKIVDQNIRLAFSPGGARLATAHYNQADVWDVAKQKLIKHFDMGDRIANRIYTLAFSPDGRYLATGGNDTTVLLWDLRGAE